MPATGHACAVPAAADAHLLVAAVDDVHPGGDVRVAAGGGDVFQDLNMLGGHHLQAGTYRSLLSVPN